MSRDVEEMKELRSKMIFFGYASKDLDAISEAYTKRFEQKPPAFLAKSPFDIYGNIDNKRKLVVSEKYGAANIILVAKMLDRAGLENTIYLLGETNQKIYVSRRKAVELQEKKEEAQTLTYEKHCAYCGIKYITLAGSPAQTCGRPKCNIKHEEHIELQRKLVRESNARSKAAEKIENPKVVLPDFSLDNPANSSLQGYIYCVRAENGFCKIGRSSDVEDRFATLVTMSPINLYLEHTVFSDNYVLAESYIHDELKAYRHHGEWFDLPESVFKWVKSLDNYELDAA